MDRRRISLFLSLGLVALIIGVRVAFGSSFEPKVLIEKLRDWGSGGWALPLYGVLYVLSTTALLPAAVLHVVAGATWGFWGGLWPNMVLANFVGHLHFAVGRWLGRERMRALLIRRKWTAALDELEHSGIFTVLVLRQTPIPFVGTNLVCGASPITWTQFLIGHFVGLIPGVIIWTWFASAIAQGVDDARDEAVVKVFLAGGAMALSAIVMRLVVGALRRRRKALGAESDQRTTPT